MREASLLAFRSYLPLIKNFFTYVAGAAVLRAVTGITAIMALRVLSPAEFGSLALVNTFVSLFPIFLNWGLRQALWLEYFHLDERERWQTINELIALYLVIAVPIITVSFFYIPVIKNVFFRDSVSTAVVIVALVYCFIQFFSELYIQLLRNQFRARALTLLQVGAACCAILANLFLVFFCGFKVLGAILANTIGIGVVAVAGVVYYLREEGHSFHFKNFLFRAKYLFMLGLPFVPNILFASVLSSGNRWLLAYLSSMDQVGLYALADLFGQAFVMCILTPLSSAYVPHMLDQYTKNKDNLMPIEKRNFTLMWIVMAAMLVCITLGTFALAYVGPYFLPVRYLQSIKYVWWILLANTLLLGTYFSSCLLVFYKKSWHIVGMSIGAGVIQILFGFALIPHLGIAGALCAQICAYAIFFYLNYVGAKKLLRSLCGG